MKKKFVIVGHSASGKDFLLKKLIEKGLKYGPKITTRPKRDGEIDGVEYYFLENNISFLQQHKTKEVFVINNTEWIYIITNENFNNNEVFIMTSGELKQLSKEDRKNCFVVYLNIDEDIRRKRLIERNSNADSIDRRINSDKKDFENFNNYDLLITDAGFDINEIHRVFAEL